MKLRLLLLATLMVGIFSTAKAQLPNGSNAPDFTLNDIDGNEHNLYSYLNSGKMVILDFSATWCPPCWTYHQSGALEDLYEMYGPDGTDEVMVFMIEGDVGTNMDDLMGNTSGTMGDWITGTPYPIIDLQNSTVTQQYQIGYWPTIYAVSPAGEVYESGQVPTASQYSWLQSFLMEVSVEDVVAGNCFGESSASVAVENGNAPFTYNWSGSNVNAPMIDNVPGGTYSVQVTDANGYTQTISNIELPGPQEDLTFDEIVVDNLSCFEDGTGTATATATGGNDGGYTYAWSDGTQDATIANVAAGTYTVSVYDAMNCETVQSIDITQPDLLTGVSVSQPEFCDETNGVLDVSPNGGTGPYSATVTGDNYDETISGDILFFENLATGSYDIMLSDANGCSVEMTQTVDYISGPEVEVFGDLEISCQVSSLTLDAFTNGGTGEFEYQWTTTDGNIVTDADLSSIEVNAPGEYFVVITDLVTGCQADASELIVGNNDLPVAAAGDDQAITCLQDQVTLDATGSQSGADIAYSWEDENGNVIGTDQTITVSDAGTYTLNVTNTDNGCASADAVEVMDNREFVSPSYTSETDELAVQFSDNSTGNATAWVWDFGDGATSTEQNPSHTFPISGTYNVCLTATNDCGSESTCTDVVVQSSGSALSAVGNAANVLCNGDATGSIDLSVVGGTAPYSFSWTDGANFTSDQEDITDLGAGIYSVDITDAENNVVNLEFTIGEPDAVVVNANVADVLCNGGADGIVVVQTEGGVAPYTYSWSTGNTTEQLDGLVAGMYTVEVTDANGCAQTLDYMVGEPDMLVISEAVVSDEQSADVLGSITITVIGGTLPYSYAWSNGSTSSEITDVAAGEYSVVVTDANGCIVGSDTFEVMGFSTSVADVILTEAIALSPNPATDHVVISWDYAIENELTLNIANQLGQIVKQVVLPQTQEGRQQIALDGLSQGMYYLSFADGQKVAVKKLFIGR